MVSDNDCDVAVCDIKGRGDFSHQAILDVLCIYKIYACAYICKIVFTFFPIFMLFIPAYTWLRKWRKQSNKTLYATGQAKTISAMPSGQVKNYKNNIF